MPTHSLRRRLLGSVMVVILLAALFQAYSAYRGALQQADEMFDYHLQQMAYSLKAGPSWTAPQWQADGTEEADYLIQIWGANGVQLFQSARGVAPPRAVLGFSDATLSGSRYRIYSLQTPFQTIQVAQDMTARETRARALAVRAMLPMALVAPLLMLTLWWVIRRSLAPVERIRQQVARRELDDLSLLPDDGLPAEVQPLVRELNLLFDRLKTSADAQRSFVANAAHELRSPLTALKVQGQALARAAPGGEPSHEVVRLNLGIDRAIRMMNQLLVLARHEGAPAGHQTMASVNLSALATIAASDASQQALQRSIELEQHIDQPVWIEGDADALQILLRNLLDNAVKYSPRGGTVRVSIEQDGRRTLLAVEDSGPGIPTEDHDKVVARFYRGADASVSADGSGLGLAIVQTIASRHGAHLTFGKSEDLGGLRVQVEFPVKGRQPLRLT